MRALQLRAPLATRIMMTGCVDPNTAVDAVNQAGVFRFLRKPCTGDELSKAVQDGVLASVRQRDMLDTSRRADETLKQTTTLFSNMSHELRTPLNHIIGFAEVLEHQLEHDGTSRDYVSTIRESGCNMNEIVNSLMDFGAVQSGQYKLDRKPVSLNALIDDCIDRAKPFCEEKAIRLHVDVPEQEFDVFVDSQALSACVFNLLSNAIKFSHHGGAVLLSASLDAESNLKILVSDHGIGIEASFLDQVMYPFTREAGVYDGSFGGIGMGLPLAKALVGLHGGRLELESCIDEGTNARIVVPARSLESAEYDSAANVVAFPDRSDGAV